MRNRQSIRGAGLEEAVRLMPAAVIVVEASSGELVFANDRARRLVEQNLGRSMPQGLAGFYDFGMSYPDGRAVETGDLPLARTLTSGEETTDEEYLCFAADGSRRWLRLSSSPIYDGEGHVVAAILVVQDVTEHKRSEETLAYHAHLLHNLHDAVIVTDENLVVTTWNRGAEEMYGYGAEEALGRDVREVAPGRTGGERWGEILRELSGTDRVRAERDTNRRYGTPLCVEATAVALRGERGGISGYLSIDRDITERRRAEEALAETRRRKEEVLESITDAFYALDSEWRITYVNERALRYMQHSTPEDEELTREEMIGRDFWRIFPEVVGTTFDHRYHEALREQKTVHFEEYSPMVQAWVEAHVYPSGEGLSIYFHDITERKRYEQRLAEVREAERSRIARDLHDEALQDLSRAAAEAQRLQANPGQADRLQRLVEALERSGRRLRGAIYDLRLEGERDGTFPELLRSLVERHRGLSPDLDISLKVADGVPAQPLGTTGREILRIVGEALTNARLHSGAASIRVAAGSSEKGLWAEVRDSGDGFEATGESPTRDGHGMGVGGMRERARALGGELEIRSEPAEGTKVRFELAAHGDREEPADERVSVLLVEDLTTVREAIASAFEREAGFTVAGQAASLSEARWIIWERPVDVAVIDLVLPDGYGGDLIGELREASPQSQALVLSANLDRVEMARAVEAGAAGVLHKTAHLDEVAQTVRRLRAGETLLTPEETAELLRFTSRDREEERQARRAIEGLTPREIEVLQALARGLSSEGIAERLRISVRTERNHVASIFAKLGVHSRLGALVFALRYGVVEIDRGE